VSIYFSTVCEPALYKLILERRTSRVWLSHILYFIYQRVGVWFECHVFWKCYTWPAFNFLLPLHTDLTLSLIFMYLAAFTMSHNGTNGMMNKDQSVSFGYTEWTKSACILVTLHPINILVSTLNNNYSSLASKVTSSFRCF
jgi:hypothetical protein